MKQLIWLDPDPVEDTDYRVYSFQKEKESETAFIIYGDDSEAEVPMEEIVMAEEIYAEDGEDFQIYFYKDTGKKVPADEIIGYEFEDQLFLLPGITMNG